MAISYVYSYYFLKTSHASLGPYYCGSCASLKFISESLIAIRIAHQILINPQDKAAMGISGKLLYWTDTLVKK